ncbi:uncharacterized protein E6C27_scaffold157G00700 [Cucumis melo var. makuwa]|uniref:DUF1985 domain-containing protein n=1 Tax=Cucumis melo var. makuwa TaxID=1194695 RepID=A0A5A7TXK2_CUCMM|nr:uncharacterized protein E6C27_scaffold157G00700 [Cucumis melo var. makuwa]
MLDLKHVKMLDDKEKFRNYPWGRLCFSLTKQFIQNAVKSKRKFKNLETESKVYAFLQGFPMVLAYWAYEILHQLASGNRRQVSRPISRAVQPSRVAISPIQLASLRLDQLAPPSPSNFSQFVRQLSHNFEPVPRPPARRHISAPSLDPYHPFATRVAPSAVVDPRFRPKQETRAFDPEPDPRSRSAPLRRAHMQAAPRAPASRAVPPFSRKPSRTRVVPALSRATPQGQTLQPRPRDLTAWKAHFLAVRTRRANLQVLPRDIEDQIFVPTRAHVARVRERARDWVEVEVGARASWRATKSDCGRMPPRRGVRRGGGREGRGADRGQPEEQPTVPAVDPNAPVTQADLTAMEQRYQDMLQAALAPFFATQQNQVAPV